MDRRAFLAALTGGVLVALPAWAEDYVERIVKELQRRGYRNIEVSRTLLGRVRIVATGKRGTREIILNPSTGEILRDLTTGGGGSGPGEILGDDDDDDDDDNGGGGGGGGNSGSGGGGSGSGSGGGSGGDDDDDDDDDD